MALTNAQLIQLIEDNIPDNNVGFVTPSLTREVLLAQNDSYLNLISNQQIIGLGEFDPSLSYQLGVGVIFNGNIYQALTQTSIGSFIPSEWEQVSTLISGTNGLDDYILRDNGIELDDDKRTPIVLTDSDLSTLDSGFYKVEQNSAPFGLGQEYPTTGQALLQVYRHQSQSQTILFHYPMGDLTRYYVKRETSAWTEFFNNTDSTLIFNNGIILDDGTIGLGGTLIKDTIIDLDTFDLSFDSKPISYTGDFSTSFMDNDLITKKFLNETAVLTVNGVNPVDGNVNTPPPTTAGILSRIYFTGEEVILNSGTYYKTASTKGSISVNQVVVNNDNQKQFFTQDVMGDSFPIDVVGQAGSYTAQITAAVDSENAQQRFTIETYLSDTSGNVIDSGLDTPVGDLGVRVITIMDSGIVDLTADNISQVVLTSFLPVDYVILTGQRVRYHVSAEKVGITGGNVTMSVYYGSDYNSFIDVPVTLNSDNVVNLSTVIGTNVSQALNNLKFDAGNGLTKLDGTVGLGGTLTQTTSIIPDVNGSHDFNLGTSDFTNGYFDNINMGVRNNVYMEANATGDYSNAYAYINLDGNNSGGTKSRIELFASNTGGTSSSNIKVNSESVTIDAENVLYQYNGNNLKTNIDLGLGISRMELRTISASERMHIEQSVTGIEVRDDLADKGMSYFADYSANNTTNDRWLTDKEYVDGLVAGASTSVNNGIEDLSGSTYGLGGTLIQNTAINGGGFDLELGVNGDKLNTFKVDAFLGSQTYSSGASVLTITDNPGGRSVSSTNGTHVSNLEVHPISVTLLSTNEVILKTTGINGNVFNVHDSLGAIYTDNAAVGGIKYNADYSVNFTNRSLVDKEYVDGVVSSASNGLTKVGSDIQLGGSLTSNVAIDGGNIRNFTVSQMSSVFITGNQSAIMQSARGSIQTSDSAGSGLVLDTSDAVKITSDNGQGAIYTADYSSTFVDRSLVDKEYVDSEIAAASTSGGGGLTLITGQATITQSTLNGNTDYTYNVTMTGAVDTDTVAASYNLNLYNSLNAQDTIIDATVISANTVQVRLRIDSFVNVTANSKINVRIIQ